MVLSTHALAGSAIAIAFRSNPIAAIIAAFFSHYILDAVPHWHYKILSKSADKSSPFGEKLDFGGIFFKDILRTGIDFGLGLAVSLTIAGILFPENLWLVFWGAFAGALPDALQVLYYRFKNFKPLYWHQLFHKKMHSKKRLDGEPINGIIQQIILSAIIIFSIGYFL